MILPQLMYQKLLEVTLSKPNARLQQGIKLDPVSYIQRVAKELNSGLLEADPTERQG